MKKDILRSPKKKRSTHTDNVLLQNSTTLKYLYKYYTKILRNVKEEMYG